jgi:hypothetical protein
MALPRIPVPASPVEPLPTVALTIAVTAPEASPASVPAPVPARAETATVAAEPPAAESHERIYEEAMATIAALASNWSSAVQRSSGRHRAAA